MAESKLLQELRDEYAFNLHLREEEGRWTGQVWRFPNPFRQQSAWGMACGTICRGNSEEAVKKQLLALVDQYDQ